MLIIKEKFSIIHQAQKTIYIEKFKMLKEKNEIFDKIISQQEEENNLLVKKVEELENILKTKINLNNKTLIKSFLI